MDILEIILISLSLAMDAFAVALCKGLSLKKMDYKKALIVGLYFGFFQALMPLIGFLLGENFENTIIHIDHYVVLFLLSLIGINMIIESTKNTCELNDKVDFKTMIVLALATSIDALAVGISFAFLKLNIHLAIALIGIITFLLSFIAVKIGFFFGNKLQNKAELLGGIILILIGLKILLEHLGYISP